jgi:uroporphyrinogen-III decarboxylase
MTKKISSRERMLAAIECRQPDRVPLCFMIFSALQHRCRDEFEFVQRQLELGLDAVVDLRGLPFCRPEERSEIGGLPIRFRPAVEVREWREERAGEPCPLLCKEYVTPGGRLTAEVHQSSDWPHGNRVPFLDDYLIPRSAKFLVERRDDLRPLQHLLGPPSSADIANLREYAAAAQAVARKHQALVSAGWGSAMETAAWLCGIRNLVFLAFDQPDFVMELGTMLAEWNRSRMDAVLDVGVDLFIRRGWYENANFWSPAMYRRFLFPDLARDVRMAHEAGAKFGYIMTCRSMPLLEMIMEAGVDVLIGVDPVQGVDTRLAEMKRAAAGKLCLWGGVNGFVTVERGQPAEVCKAVEEAVHALSPGGGFILSPVDNIRDPSERVWQNVLALIEAWKRTCTYS